MLTLTLTLNLIQTLTLTLTGNSTRRNKSTLTHISCFRTNLIWPRNTNMILTKSSLKLTLSKYFYWQANLLCLLDVFFNRQWVGIPYVCQLCSYPRRLIRLFAWSRLHFTVISKMLLKSTAKQESSHHLYRRYVFCCCERICFSHTTKYLKRVCWSLNYLDSHIPFLII